MGEGLNWRFDIISRSLTPVWSQCIAFVFLLLPVSSFLFSLSLSFPFLSLVFLFFLSKVLEKLITKSKSQSKRGKTYLYMYSVFEICLEYGNGGKEIAKERERLSVCACVCVLERVGWGVEEHASNIRHAATIYMYSVSEICLEYGNGRKQIVKERETQCVGMCVCVLWRGGAQCCRICKQHQTGCHSHWHGPCRHLCQRTSSGLVPRGLG